MEPKQYYIGIDVGGTSVKEGLFDEDGNLLAKASVPTPPIVDAAGFAAVTEAIDQVIAKAQIPRAFVAGIGLAVPCPIPASGDAKVKPALFQCFIVTEPPRFFTLWGGHFR